MKHYVAALLDLPLAALTRLGEYADTLSLRLYYWETRS